MRLHSALVLLQLTLSRRCSYTYRIENSIPLEACCLIIWRKWSCTARILGKTVWKFAPAPCALLGNSVKPHDDICNLKETRKLCNAIVRNPSRDIMVQKLRCSVAFDFRETKIPSGCVGIAIDAKLFSDTNFLSMICEENLHCQPAA